MVPEETLRIDKVTLEEEEIEDQPQKDPPIIETEPDLKIMVTTD